MTTAKKSPFWFAFAYWIFLGVLTIFDGHGSPWLLPFFSEIFTPFLGLMVPKVNSHRWSFAGVLTVYVALLLAAFSLTLATKPGYISYANVAKPQEIAVYISLFSIPALVFIAILIRPFFREKGQL